jgi:hypothetical protein
MPQRSATCAPRGFKLGLRRWSVECRSRVASYRCSSKQTSCVPMGTDTVLPDQGMSNRLRRLARGIFVEDGIPHRHQPSLCREWFGSELKSRRRAWFTPRRGRSCLSQLVVLLDHVSASKSLECSTAAPNRKARPLGEPVDSCLQSKTEVDDRYRLSRIYLTVVCQ